MDISVIIPTYNRSQTISRALDSVTSQTYRVLEIIVVDDGSTDDTQHIISSHYPDVRYCYRENAGVSSARNRGIELARGDWIALLDSDDAWLPEKLGIQVEALRAHPDHQLCHTNEIWIRNGQRVNQMRKHRKWGGNIFEKCLPRCVISPSSVLVERTLFDEIGVFDESLPACEDYDLWLRICARKPVFFIDRPLIRKYGGHPDQLSRKFWGMDRFRIKALQKILESGQLDNARRKAALKEIVSKLRIYIGGAYKRDRTDGIAVFEHLLERSQAELASAFHIS